MLLMHVATIRRSRPTGTAGRRALAELSKGVRCLVLPMNDGTTIRHNYTLGLAYDVYFPAGQDVKMGDQLVVDGLKYSVRSVQPFNVPRVGHVRALCEQEVSS